MTQYLYNPFLLQMILIYKIISGLNVSGIEDKLDTGFSSSYSFFLSLLVFFGQNILNILCFLSSKEIGIHTFNLFSFALVIRILTHISSFHSEHSKNVIMVSEYFKIDKIMMPKNNIRKMRENKHE